MVQLTRERYAPETVWTGFPRSNQLPWIKEDVGRETVKSEKEISETFEKMIEQI